MNSSTTNTFFTSKFSYSSKNRLLVRLIFFIAISVWCFGFTCRSILPDSAYTAIASLFLKRIYGAVCHQHIEKTIFSGGYYFFVCARCTGIYFGVLMASFNSLIILHRLPVKTKLLYISSVPMLIDVISTTIGIYPYSKIIALLTGIFFGSAVFVYILAALENNFMDKPI
jgi:uncharacterized membrane protein